MRWVLFVALLGCTSQTEDLHDLEQHSMDCGGVPQDCARTTDVTAVVTCMNDALASGTLASAVWSVEEEGHDYYIFTEGDHLRVFTTPFACIDGPEVLSQKTCTGPLETTTTAACGEYLQLKIDGC